MAKICQLRCLTSATAILLLIFVVSASSAELSPPSANDSLNAIPSTSIGILLDTNKHQQGMTVWQFVHRLIRQQATSTEAAFMLDQLENASRVLVDELDKHQNYYYNETLAEIVPFHRPQEEKAEYGEKFQNWLERTFDVSYRWAKESKMEQYRAIASDFKAFRDWISGLSNLNRFTDEHLQIVTDFFRAQSLRADWNTTSPAAVFAEFKKFVINSDDTTTTAANSSSSTALLVVRHRRAIFTPPRTNTGWRWWFSTIFDYIQDFVVMYNRAQTTMWPAKMAVSLLAPPVKFIWTGVDIFTCLWEEIYELKFAQSTEERWWDIFLCGLEFLGVFPAAGVVKFGLRIAIRSLKMYFGIHTVPWYLSRPYTAIQDWWYGNGGATTIAAAVTAVTARAVSAVLVTDAPPPSYIMGSMSNRG